MTIKPDQCAQILPMECGRHFYKRAVIAFKQIGIVQATFVALLARLHSVPNTIEYPVHQLQFKANHHNFRVLIVQRQTDSESKARPFVVFRHFYHRPAMILNLMNDIPVKVILSIR